MTDPDRFDITLLHGLENQEESPAIDRSVFLRPYNSNSVGLYRWVSDAKNWLKAHYTEFDVLHGLLGFHCTMAPAHYADTVLGLPAAIFIANHTVDLGSKRGLKSILRLPQRRQKMAREVSNVIGMSTEIREELRGYGLDEHRISPIPMGVNLNRFKPASPEDRASLRDRFGLKQSKTIAFSGTLCDRKMPHLIVEALAKAHTDGKDWRVLFAGPEPENEYNKKTRELAQRLGVMDRIHWIGFTRAIEDVYAAADVYCLPSTNEGMPASVVEAMSTGLPSVITNFSSAHDLIPSKEIGEIVDGNSDSVYKALDGLLENPDRLLIASKAARAHALAHFEVGSVLDQYEELFKSMMKK